MIPKLNGFQLLEEENSDYLDPDQETFDWEAALAEKNDEEDED